MKFRPILFSGPMVRAILDGRKTQTRRPYKPRWGYELEDRDDGLWPYYTAWTFGDDGSPWLPCPLGEPGDELWARETWRPVIEAWSSCVEYAAGGSRTMPDATELMQWSEVHGAALRMSGANKALDTERWRPSIHMPRWASRLTLRVTSVRVERLRDITEEDARAEGFATRADFAAAWRAIYGDAAWDANRYVWVGGFEVSGGAK